MGTPFKMKGHELPGPNQKAAPMTEPITAALIGAAASGLISGTTSVISSAQKRKKAKREAAAGKAQEGMQQAGSMSASGAGSGAGAGGLGRRIRLDRKDKQAIILVVLMYNTTDCLLVFGRRTRQTSCIYMGYLLAFVWDI